MKKITSILIILICICAIFYFYYFRNNEIRMNKVEVNNIATENSSITGKAYKYNNPIIPKGFKAVNEGAEWNIEGDIVQGWNKGLVIEDEEGNQFVWVPVKDGVGQDGIYEDELEKVCYQKWRVYEETLTYEDEGKEYKVTIDEITEDSLPEGIDNEYSQIEKYGGFYIARFESGISEEVLKESYELEDDYDFVQIDIRNDEIEGKPVSKKNAQVWNFIEYENAKNVAESMYKTDSVISGITTGRQFDTILRWGEVNGYNFEKANEWGNFYNTVNVEYKGRYASFLRRTYVDWTLKDYGVKKEEKRIITSSGRSRNSENE